MKEELRYATKISGVLCVMIAGVPLTHKWCVDSLDLQRQVLLLSLCILNGIR